MIFSIITVSYNAETCIRETIESILSQSFPDYEILVKDGLSIDGTLEKVPHDNKIKIIQKSDCGIYDAMNQAIHEAKGDYLIFMNCGDVFSDINVLRNLEQFLSDNREADVVYGNYAVGNTINYQPERLTAFYLYRTPLCHQSMIIKRKLFHEVGEYDCQYKILSDYNFTQKCWHSGKVFKHIPLNICCYLGGGVSESLEGMKKKEAERKVILSNNYPLVIRLMYDVILVFTLRKFRIWLMSGHSPEWMRKLYKILANYINS